MIAAHIIAEIRGRCVRIKSPSLANLDRARLLKAIDDYDEAVREAYTILTEHECDPLGDCLGCVVSRRLVHLNAWREATA